MTFAFVSGDVALDLTNTLEHRHTDPTEHLRVPEDLARWLVQAGVVDGTVRTGKDDLATALRLREAVRRLATGEPAPADRRTLNQLAKEPPVRVRLAKDGSVTHTGDVAAALATVARSAVELLGGGSTHGLRECDAPDCSRLYMDNSRRGARRWCDMRTCGNRAKVATFRARHN